MVMAEMRRVRWRPAGSATTFVLAALGGVAGNQLTGHLTVALVVFAALLVAGAAVTFALEHFPATRDSGNGQDTTDIGSPGGKHDLRGARGVQLGDSNRQVNYFGANPGPDR